MLSTDDTQAEENKIVSKNWDELSFFKKQETGTAFRAKSCGSSSATRSME